MDDSKLKKKTLVGLFWKFLERCGVQGVGFVVSIVLARMLDPSDYGILALVTVFTSIFGIFGDFGLGSALVQKKDADEVDYSSVFYCNIVSCVVLYVILFFTAPLFSWFYENDSLTLIIRVLGLSIPISGFRVVQNAYLSQKMQFKKMFFATLGGTIGAAVVGIVMAYYGFGVWALVGQHLFNTLFGTIALWVVVRWHPKWLFSFARIKVLFSYGWKILVSNFINTLYNDIRQLIVGKMYSTADLGQYNRGKQFPHLIVDNVNSSIDGVLFPVLSKCQNDVSRVKEITRKAIRTSGYIMWPLLLGMAAVGEPMVTLLLTEKWLPCLPFLYIFCFANGFVPVSTANLNAIKAMGRSDLNLKMEIIKKSFAVIMIIVSVPFGVLAIALSGIPITLFACAVNIFPNRKLLGYSYLEQFKDMAPSFLMALVMAVAVYFMSWIPLPLIVILILQVATGAVIYILESIILKNGTFKYLLGTLKGFLSKKEKKSETVNENKES